MNIFRGGVETSIATNVYTGWKISDNLIGCAGLSAEVAYDHHSDQYKLNPGLHTSLNYFWGKDNYSVCFNLDYYGKRTYAYYYEGMNTNFKYSLVPTLKVRAPFWELIKEINIDLADFL